VWIAPPGTELFQPGDTLPESVLVRARTTPGVALAEPLIAAGATVRRPEGGSEAVTLIGTALPARLGGPWSLVAGDVRALDAPDTVFFEDAERAKYGGMDLGTVREVNGRRVRAGGFTWGLLPFGPAYAFAELGLARELARIPTDRQNFVLVTVRPGELPEAVRDRLAARIPEARVLTQTEFSGAIVSALLREQLGVSFGTSTAFGLIIGFIIVALSMFSSVIDNLREFGTLKAIGCTNLDLTGLLLVQSVAYAVLGTFVGLGLVSGMTEGIRSPQLVPIVPMPLYVLTPLVMVSICVAAAGLALFRIRKLEPGMVFR
jgi:putative ABC transport system permease protein